jgi:hypothetical protein
LRVELVESLGTEALVHGRFVSDGPTVIARLDSADARVLRSGHTVPLSAPPSALHLFDAHTERALG